MYDVEVQSDEEMYTSRIGIGGEQMDDETNKK